MRSAFDKLLSGFGFALAAVLLIAGGLLTWASVFVGDTVHDQLSQQDITMPSGAALDALPAGDKAALEPYAGQQMTTGPQAKAYADHFILVHMNKGGAELAETAGWQQPMTDSSAGAVSKEIAAETTLSDSVKTEATTAVNTCRSDTLFTGNTLRGLLLYGYAFATIGTIAGYAAIAAFVGAGVLLILAILGLWHARRAQQTVRSATVLEPTLATV